MCALGRLLPVTPKEECAAHLWKRRGSPRWAPTRPSRETPARAARPVTGRAAPRREREEAPPRAVPRRGPAPGRSEAVVSSWLPPGPVPAAGRYLRHQAGQRVKEHPWDSWAWSAVEGETSEVSLRKQLAQGAAGMSAGGAPEQKEPRGSHVT